MSLRSRIQRQVVDKLESTCSLLDQIPTWERVDGEWRRIGGCFGCRWGLSRLSCELDERWATGVWHP